MGILFLSSHLFLSFNPVRIRPLESRLLPAAGVVTVPLREPSGASGARPPRLLQLPDPFAVIARVDNRSDHAFELTLSLGANTLCRQTVTPGPNKRIDCPGVGRVGAGSVFAASAPGDDWSLTYLEFATHHGQSSVGAQELVVVPAESHAYERPSWLALLLPWFLWTAALAWHSTRVPRWLDRLVGCAGLPPVLLLAALLWLAPLVSPFAGIVPYRRLVAYLTVMALLRAYPNVLDYVSPPFSLGRVRTRVARCLLVALLVTAMYGLVVHQRAVESYRGNYGGLLLVSEKRFDANPSLRGLPEVRRSMLLRKDGGYDGQFAYFETFDPFLWTHRHDPAAYSEFIDAPPYRFGRIGQSVLTRIFSANQPIYYPQTMFALVLLGIFATTTILAGLALERGKDVAIAALVLFIPGFWQSAQVGLPEPLAAAFVLGGCLLARRSRWWQAGIVFALALLTRETSAVFIGGLVVWLGVIERRRAAWWMAAVAFTPWLLWKAYVGWVLYPVWGSQAFLFDPRNMGAPFRGLQRMWNDALSGTYYPNEPAMCRAGLYYPPILVAALLLSLVTLVWAPGPVSFAALVYAGVAISLNYDSIWVSIRNGERGTYEVFLMLLTALVLEKRRSRLTMALGVFWAASAVYWAFGDFDAEFIRHALTEPLRGLVF